ncbi:hypothetical protein [Polaromonas sp.]|uniref:hypothetical protein n=1 Tax=Polaromonas sp. TaxID=1869339 RepID=UPI002FCB4928
MKRFLHALLFAAAGVQAETVRWTEVIRQKKHQTRMSLQESVLRSVLMQKTAIAACFSVLHGLFSCASIIWLYIQVGSPKWMLSWSTRWYARSQKNC